MPIPPTGHTCFSIQDAMQEYGKYSGKGKMKLIQYWINNNYIPCQKTRFFQLYNLFKHKSLPDDVQWMDGPGRKPLLSLQEVEQLVTEAQNASSGRSYSMNDINGTLNKAREKQLKDKGQSVLVSKGVHRSTVDNYKGIAALCNISVIVNKVQQKTDNRYTAETSLLSTLCYLMTVATSHLVVGDRDESVNPHPIEDATPGAILLHNLVQDCNS